MKLNSIIPHFAIGLAVLVIAAQACSPMPAASPTLKPSITPSATEVAATPTQAVTKTATTTITTVTTAATVAATSTPSPAPTVTPTAAPAPLLTSIHMIDEANGWGFAQGSVLYTTSGGSRWDDITPADVRGGSSWLWGFFLDASNAWVSSPDTQDYTKGALYRTSDAGRTWQSASVPFGGGWMQFLDAKNGWVMADLGTAAGSQAVSLYFTTDGGSTWQLAYSIDPTKPKGNNGLPFGGDKTGMTFRDMTHGWVGGTEPMDGYIWLFATGDGGKNWQHQSFTLPKGLEKSFVIVEAPHFFNAQDGVLPVRFSADTTSMNFYLTHDGGATWKATTTVPRGGVYSIPSLQDFFVWDGTTLSVSHDGGSSWNEINPNVNLKDILSGLDFINGSSGWALSMDADSHVQAYHTGDGGATWTALFP